MSEKPYTAFLVLVNENGETQVAAKVGGIDVMKEASPRDVEAACHHVIQTIQASRIAGEVARAQQANINRLMGRSEKGLVLPKGGV